MLRPSYCLMQRFSFYFRHMMSLAQLVRLSRARTRFSNSVYYAFLKLNSVNYEFLNFLKYEYFKVRTRIYYL